MPTVKDSHFAIDKILPFYVDVENELEDTGRGKGKLGRSERVAWTYITTKCKIDS